MTLLELITNCINYTTQDDVDISPETLNVFKNSSNYSAFIKNALPEVNRAIQEIVAWKKIPLKTMSIVMDNNYVGSITNKKSKVTLTKEQKKQIYSIFKIEIEDANGNVYSPVEYTKRNDDILVPYIVGTMNIVYYPTIPIFSNKDVRDEDVYEGEILLSDLEDLYDYGLNDAVCSMVIPLLVKANIWQEIEPEMAQLERNKALQNLSLVLPAEEETYQSAVAVTNSYDWR